MGARRTGKDWSNYQRSADYYDESALIWLDADSLIREKSGGSKSMDDFAQLFFGVEDYLYSLGLTLQKDGKVDSVLWSGLPMRPCDWMRGCWHPATLMRAW
ncbi:MAG: hypothetical protein H7293_09070, partial [Candidatus Saccharibacteria bacterium]|nr:hypothetical protein [Rhodoferax sp.]